MNFFTLNPLLGDGKYDKRNLSFSIIILLLIGAERGVDAYLLILSVNFHQGLERVISIHLVLSLQNPSRFNH